MRIKRNRVILNIVKTGVSNQSVLCLNEYLCRIKNLMLKKTAYLISNSKDEGSKEFDFFQLFVRNCTKLSWNETQANQKYRGRFSPMLKY